MDRIAPPGPSLLRERRFAPYFWTQALGAMNDNVFKVGFSTLATYDALHYGALAPSLAGLLISACFVLPFIVFSATAGQLADHFDKRRLIAWIKTSEVLIMLLAAFGFWQGQGAVLYLCMLLMGLHSTFFGPVKYAFLPERLAPGHLLHGNALVESSTFIAILAGNLLGSIAALRGPPALAVLCLGLAVLGRLSASRIPAHAPPAPELRLRFNPVAVTRESLRAVSSRALLASLLGISWLWFVGATLLATVFVYASDTLHADSTVVTLLLALFSIGVGLGSALCARLAPGRQALAMVVVSGAAMSLFILDFALASLGYAPQPGARATVLGFLSRPSGWRIAADLFALSLAAGLYSVPLYTFMQARSPVAQRARVVAANNVLNALFMVASSLLGLALGALGLPLGVLYLLLAGLSVGVVCALYRMVPRFGRATRLWLGRRRRRKPGASGAAPQAR